MKKFVLYKQQAFLIWLFLVLLHSIGFAQNLGWAPIGAEWYYNYEAHVSMEIYAKYVVEKDTIVQGKTTRKISVFREWYNYDSGSTASNNGEAIITYEEDSVIYVFHNNQFDTLMNMNASPGDTWKKTGQTCDKFITVLDTGSIEINNCNNKWISYESDGYIDTFYQKNGTVERGFELIDYCELELHAFIPSSLRCYISDDCTWLKSNQPCDYLPTDLNVNETLGKNYTTSIYPNPSSSEITIDGLPQDNYNFQVSDNLGRVVLNGELTNNKIDISRLKSGVYILKLARENELFYTTKIIKE